MNPFVCGSRVAIHNVDAVHDLAANTALATTTIPAFCYLPGSTTVLEASVTTTDEATEIDTCRFLVWKTECYSLCSRNVCQNSKFCDLLKSRVECPAFLQKLECAQASVLQNIDEEDNSWDVVSENDLWEEECADANEDDNVLVREEDIVEGIACFMAAYLLSLKQTKARDNDQIF